MFGGTHTRVCVPMRFHVPLRYPIISTFLGRRKNAKKERKGNAVMGIIMLNLDDIAHKLYRRYTIAINNGNVGRIESALIFRATSTTRMYFRGLFLDATDPRASSRLSAERSF